MQAFLKDLNAVAVSIFQGRYFAVWGTWPELWALRGHQAHPLSQKCFFANALPDPDFKYLSNSKALLWLEKAIYAINFQGLYFAVWVDRPSL
jgi:hypothetical protein